MLSRPLLVRSSPFHCMGFLCMQYLDFEDSSKVLILMNSMQGQVAQPSTSSSFLIRFHQEDFSHGPQKYKKPTKMDSACSIPSKIVKRTIPYLTSEVLKLPNLRNLGPSTSKPHHCSLLKSHRSKKKAESHFWHRHLSRQSKSSKPLFHICHLNQIPHQSTNSCLSKKQLAQMEHHPWPHVAHSSKSPSRLESIEPSRQMLDFHRRSTNSSPCHNQAQLAQVIHPRSSPNSH